MFIPLFVVTLLLSAGISYGLARACEIPIERVLRQIFGASIGFGWSKYFTFAIIVTGITAGARIRALQEFVDGPSRTRQTIENSVTREFWVAEIYRTAVDTLLGIVWLLLIFFFIAIVASFLVKRMRVGQPSVEGK